ncbi:hypothetical protein [Paenibacillus sp. FSL R5-0519]|uniref:hypothetical protein n=1 Tax=Paenibacillus sp. FSL R5-0519 TaxID=2921648 RepID=UPI0030DAE65C
MRKYVLVQEQRRIEPFYRIFMRIMIGMAMLVALVMVAGPMYLISQLMTGWIWFTGGLIPLGGWFFYAMVRHIRHLSWRDHHLDRTEMDDHEIRYVRWYPDRLNPEENRFGRLAIQHVYYGRYLIKEAHFYQRAEFKEPVRTIQMWPEIHIVYRQGLENRVCTIRFYEDAEAQTWLDQLETQGVELIFTRYSTEKMAPEVEIRNALENDEGQKAASWSSLAEESYESYRKQTIQQIPSVSNREENSLEKEKRRAVKKHVKAFRSIGWAWIVFVFQWGISFLLVEQAKQGRIDPDAMFIPIVVFTGLGLLFGCMTKIFVWKHVIIYSVFFFVQAITISLVLYEVEDTSPGARMLNSLGTSGFIGILLVCVPMLVYQLRRAAFERLRKRHNHNRR